jgi:glutaredoxin
MRSFVIAAVMTVLVGGLGFVIAPEGRPRGDASRGTSSSAVDRVLDEGVATGAGTSSAAENGNGSPDPSAGGKRVFYQWTDARGSVRFAQSLDQVPAAWRERAGQVEVDTSAFQPKPVRPGASGSRLARKPFAQEAAVEERRRDLHDVTVYTAPWCGWCRKTLAFLDERGVDYRNKDIEADEDYADELAEKSGGHSIPFVEIDGAQIRGYNPTKMAALLE